MRDELAIVLRLVADGRLSPEDAAPLIDAVGRSTGGGTPAGETRRAPASTSGDGPRQLRVRVSERGRQVVNLRIPLTFADTALRMVPGLSDEQGDRIRAAIAGKTTGTILDVEDEDGDGVVISME